MIRRSVLVILLRTICLPISSTLAQTPDEQIPPAPIIESPGTAPSIDEHHLPELTKQEQEDAVVTLGELRGSVRSFPDNPDARLKLAEGLFRIGDLDAAIDEYRIAIKLKPDSAKTHLQLGVALMARQDWRAATTELKEATRFDPELTQAHYNLGTVFYTMGNLRAAIQSYQRALELQPHFPDARYRLALVLKLSHRDQESAQSMEEAAQGGVAQAQYFLGNAYRTGQGVEKNGALAVYWWTKALALGHQPAAASLSQFRRQALSPTQPMNKRQEAMQAFRGYREKLWDNFPDLSRDGETDTLGTALVKQNRTDEAVPVLLQESYALSEVAQAELARLYELGSEPQLAPFDKRILISFETTANEGFAPAKKILARIYAKGIGMTPDVPKAKAQLKGLPKHDVTSLLDELLLQP
jgi:Tfp pilus assembly protein PilF